MATLNVRLLILCIFAALNMVCQSGETIDQTESRSVGPERIVPLAYWMPVNFKIAGREASLVFDQEKTRVRMTFVLQRLRDRKGALLSDDGVRYDEVTIKVVDRDGNEVPVTLGWSDSKCFDQIPLGVGTLNGEYSLPKMDGTQLKNVQITFSGEKVTVPLSHLRVRALGHDGR